MDKKEVLKIFAYGSNLRNSIDKISKAGRGGLFIFIDYKKIKKICSGGFEINDDLSGEKLAELAKMDGAIIIDDKFEKILFANVLLTPDVKIPTSETGTRHQTAERTAKQFETLVLAVSERTKVATIYYKNKRVLLSSLNELFTKTGEALKSLEKHEDIFRELVKKFDVSEILELVTLEDIVLLFQRKKIIDFVADILSMFLAELGKEGKLIQLQLKESVNFSDRETNLMIKDYEDYFDFSKILSELDELQYDDVLDKENLFKIFLNNKKNENSLIPKGFRILRNIPVLSIEDIDLIVSKFPTLKELMISNEEDLLRKGISERKAKSIKEYLLKF